MPEIILSAITVNSVTKCNTKDQIASFCCHYMFTNFGSVQNYGGKNSAMGQKCTRIYFYTADS